MKKLVLYTAAVFMGFFLSASTTQAEPIEVFGFTLGELFDISKVDSVKTVRKNKAGALYQVMDIDRHPSFNDFQVTTNAQGQIINVKAHNKKLACAGNFDAVAENLQSKYGRGFVRKQTDGGTMIIRRGDANITAECGSTTGMKLFFMAKQIKPQPTKPTMIMSGF